MIGVGWLVLMDDWLSRGGPAGGILGFLLGGLLLFPIAHTYGRLVQRIQDAGAEIAYTEGVMPPLGQLRAPAGRWCCRTRSCARGRRSRPATCWRASSRRSTAISSTRSAAAPIYAPRLAVGLALTALIAGVNYRGIKPSGIFQDVMTFGLLATFAIFTLLGFAQRIAREHAAAVRATGQRRRWLSIFLVLQIVPYFMTGFESVAKGSEEAQRGLRSAQLHERRSTRRWSPGFSSTCIIIAVVTYVYPWQEIVSGHVRTEVAFERTFGSHRDRAADSVRRVPVAAEDLQRQLRRGDADALRDRPPQPRAPVARPRARDLRHAGGRDRR